MSKAKAAKKKPAKAEENDPIAAPLNAVAEALDDAQRSLATHKRSAQALLAAMQQDPKSFFNIFTNCVKPALLISKKEPAVERLMQFIASFVCLAGSGAEERADFMTNFIRYRVHGTSAPYHCVPLLSRFLLEDKVGAKDRAVRYRSVQLIGRLLHQMPEDTELDEDLFQDIEQAMLTRSRDTVAAVRVEAIQALARLQDCTDPENEVLKEYLRVLNSDPIKDCRMAVLENLAPSKLTLAQIIDRARDQAPAVRKLAYDVIGQKLAVKQLSISQRVRIVEMGLQDRDPSVQKACGNMLLSAWLRKAEGDVFAVLDCLEAESNVPVAELALKHMFGQDFKAATERTQQPPYTQDDLTATKPAREELLEKYLPDLSKFCSLIEAHKGSVFIATELLKLCLNADMQDEAGKRRLAALQMELLRELDTHAELVPLCMHVLRTLYAGDEAGYINVVLELLADIRDPLEDTESDENKSQRAELEARFQQLQRALDELKAEKQLFVQQDKFLEAHNTTQKMVAVASELEAMEKDMSTTVYQGTNAWIRMLAIVGDLLQFTRRDLRHPGLQGLLETTILPALNQTHEMVQTATVRCLGLYCQLDMGQARHYLPLFVSVLRNEGESDADVQNKFTAWRTLFDLLMVYEGLLAQPPVAPRPATQAENKEEEDAKSSDADAEAEAAAAQENASRVTVDTVIEVVAPYLDAAAEDESDELIDMRSLVVEGVAKLFVFDRLTDSGTLHALLRLFFHPGTERMPRVRQCLTVFFPAYARGSAQHAQAVFDAFEPTLRATVYPDRGSALAKVKHTELVEFFVALLANAPVPSAAVSAVKPEDGGQGSTSLAEALPSPLSFHERLAFDVCYRLLAAPEGQMAKPLCHALPLLAVRAQLPPAQAQGEAQGETQGRAQDHIKALRQLLADVAEAVPDKMAVKQVVKAQDTLTGLDETPEEALSAEMTRALARERSRRVREVEEQEDGADSNVSPAAKKKSRLRAKQEDGLESQDSEAEAEAKAEKKKRATKPRAKPAAAVAKPKRPAAKKPAAKKGAAAAAAVSAKAKKEEQGEEDADELSSASAAASPVMTPRPAPAKPVAAKPKPASTKAKKASVGVGAGSAAAAKKKKPASSKSWNGDDDDDDDGDAAPVKAKPAAKPAAKPKTAAKPKAKAAAPKRASKAKKVASDSESESESEASEAEEASTSRAKPKAKAPAAPAAPVSARSAGAGARASKANARKKMEAAMDEIDKLLESESDSEGGSGSGTEGESESESGSESSAHSGSESEEEAPKQRKGKAASAAKPKVKAKPAAKKTGKAPMSAKEKEAAVAARVKEAEDLLDEDESDDNE